MGGSELTAFPTSGRRKGSRIPFAKVTVSVVSESLDKLLAASCPQSHVQQQKQLMPELNVFYTIVSVKQPCHAKDSKAFCIRWQSHLQPIHTPLHASRHLWVTFGA